MKTIGLAGLSLVVMASLAACSDDDGDDNTQPVADSGVTTDTGSVTDTGSPPVDSAVPDTGSPGDTSTDAPVVADPKFTVLKLSDTLHDRLFGLTFDSAGNIFATGSIAEGTATDADSSMILVKIKPDGTLDKTFGTMGVAKKNVIAKKNGEAARGVLVQADGKIVIAGAAEHEGATDDRDRDIVLVRFNADGTVDTTFGTAGVQVHDLSAGEVVGTAYVADAFWDLKPAPSGGGMFIFGSQKAPGRTDTDYAVVKLKADGSKDTTWGTSGVTMVDVSNKNASARFGTVLADGSVIGSGYWTDGDSVVRPAIFKLKADGTLDSTFGTGGIFSSIVLAMVGEVYGAAQQGTNLVTVGYGRASMTENLDFLSIRLSGAGVRDMTYGTGGHTRIDVAMQNDNGRALVVLPDERVMMFGGGRPTATNVDGMVALLAKDGKADTTFGTGGYRLFDFGGVSDMLWAAAISPSKDQIAAVGLTGGAMGGNDDAVVFTMPTPK